MIEYSFDKVEWFRLAPQWIEGVAWTAARMLEGHQSVTEVALTFDDDSVVYFRRREA